MCSVSGGVMEQVISFSDSDLKDVQLPYNDPLVVTLRIGNSDVERILIDQGSFAEVMYQDLYMKLGMGEAELSSFTSPIFGFSGEPVVLLGKAILPVLAGPVNLQTEFIIVNTSSPYNAIMGRDWLHRMKAIPSTLHQKLRFPTKDGVIELNRDQSQEPEEGEVIMTEQPEKVFFDPSNPEQFFLVGSKLSAVDKEQLFQVLISNRDVFAWSVYDAPGVSPELACHSLNIGSEHRPIVQKRRKLAPERATTVLGEVGRLLASGAIQEIQYPVWLSNTVVVKKKNGKWRVCIDFTDLNKACPKDPFPLPRIDQLVDSASGHARLRATYQRMFTKMFGHMIGKTVEVYIDNMLVKSLQEENHVADLLQVFNILKGKSPTSQCVQMYLWCTTPDWYGCRPWPLYFKGIKAYLSTPLCLSIPNPREQLFLYLAVSDHAVSAVLVQEFGQEQKPVFFVSKAMDETELRYLPLEKAALAVLQAAKKLPHYFQSNKVKVLSDLSLKMLLQRSDFSGRITKWGVYLGSLGVEYKPRAAIKGQVLAEFLAEFQYDPNNPSLTIPAEAQLGLVTGKCKLFVDGASNSKGSGAGVVLVTPEGLILEQAVRLTFSASNNEAEYEALLIGLRTAERLGGRSLAHRAISQGYWWPYMQTDALKYVRECDKCQRFAPMIHQPQQTISPNGLRPSRYPISGTLTLNASFGKTLLHVSAYLGLQYQDNGTQFESRLFKGFCSDLGIKNFFSSLGYPQSNGQAETSNKIILNGIKRKLEEAKGKWVEELPSVLWTHRTKARKSTGETPFALTYGVEAVIPLEVGILTSRTTDFAVQTNEDNLRKDLDLLEERRDLATVRLASYQQRIKREHDKNINHGVFRIGDLVLRKVMANTRRPNEGKLGPNWEGPYKVVSPAGAGSYRLEDLEGKPIPRPWNTCNLRKYFF
uniref:Integrase catalytic domain-containing protein n=1 Tax=Fagus sylvatica TaxID=28930 RepID=A0A2N9IVM6_FAGSY